MSERTVYTCDLCEKDDVPERLFDSADFGMFGVHIRVRLESSGLGGDEPPVHAHLACIKAVIAGTSPRVKRCGVTDAHDNPSVVATDPGQIVPSEVQLEAMVREFWDQTEGDREFWRKIVVFYERIRSERLQAGE